MEGAIKSYTGLPRSPWDSSPESGKPDEFASPIFSPLSGLDPILGWLRFGHN